MNEQLFLNKVQGKTCNVFVINGVKLWGKLVTASDNAIFLDREGILSMTYKSAVANVTPEHKIEYKDDINYNV